MICGLFAEPAGADAEQESAAAEEIERRDLLGQQQRVALGDEHDAGAELDALRHARGAGERHERIDEVRVALGDDAVGRAGEAARRVAPG